MSATVPDSHKDLLEGPVVVALATVLASGQPHVTPVWCSYDGAHVIVNTARGRVKDNVMRQDAKVTIMALDPENDQRYIQVQGVIEQETEDGALENIEAHAKVYTGKAVYFGNVVSEEMRKTMVRVMYKIQPTLVTTQG